MDKVLHQRTILIKGAGEMATGIACRLFRSNLRQILMLETASPQAVRRLVSFCEAVYDGTMAVEGIEAVRAVDAGEVHQAWAAGKIAVKVDDTWGSVGTFHPDVLVDAILAKRNLGTRLHDAPLVIGLGPGFEAGKDCHLVVETNRGHDLGRLIARGAAEANTGIPGDIDGFTRERVLRSPTEGSFVARLRIGDRVEPGDVIGEVDGIPVASPVGGILRGLIRPGSLVRSGLKIGDIDPRGEPGYCATVSEKARALGGAVLEAILSVYNR